MKAFWEDPVATDNSGDSFRISCIPPSGHNFTIGQTVVTCTAFDDSENNATCTFNITVLSKYMFFPLFGA